MKKSPGKRRSRNASPPAKKARGKGSRQPEQSEWTFEELESQAAMPRCEMTGANVDLHLVAYRDPDTGEFTARILGSDYRHLVRHKTSLSIPVAILSIVSLRQLEKLRKIPLGTRAAKQLREWLGRGTDEAWKRARRSRQLRVTQETLELPDESAQGLFRLG